MTQPISIRLRGIEGDQALLRSVRRSCETVGNALADRWEFEVTLEPLASRHAFRASVSMLSLEGVRKSVAFAREPYGATLQALAGLFDAAVQSDRRLYAELPPHESFDVCIPASPSGAQPGPSGLPDY